MSSALSFPNSISSELKQSGVTASEGTINIPTYPVPLPDKNPMFVDKRVYQGSSGKVYPIPFTDRVSDEKADRAYKAIFLENEYLRLMILPEIGGRIHIGQDKTNDYDFFYRQNVIKPALVGLAGPWISGGVEFNWPQHHRPSTYMPVESFIEEHEDGSKTVWLSEHEPMNRMKGMVGICLYPGKSFIEAKARLYNRTPLVQTFLWWANVGIRVHDQYQAFFPPDVRFVADHAKRAMSWYPIARNFYYGVDYTRGVDLGWYKNIPVPTSYMVTESKYDFFGGYDHGRRAGMVHYADRHVAPGKKLWTWGNAEFGYAWDRELTDSDGPYIELMSGVYTDNQPDFSWLQPFETKTFSQFWYPIREIGPAKNANRMLAINLERAKDKWKIGVCSTEELGQAKTQLLHGDVVLLERFADIRPDQPFVEFVTLPSGAKETDLVMRVLDNSGRELIRYAPHPTREIHLPEPAAEPPAPQEILANEELYLTGLHLEQYRHATRDPEPYWREALDRDPEDVRCNNAIGLLALRRGKFREAETHFATAVRRLTKRNPNPYDGEPFYNLGLALRFQGRLQEAYDAFYKCVWNYAWQAAGYFELACIDSVQGNPVLALGHVERALRVSTDNLKARNLKAAMLRRLGRIQEATDIARHTVEIDLLDFWSRNELTLLVDSDIPHESSAYLVELMRHDAQNTLDLAFDYADAGLLPEAADVIDRFLADSDANSASPMLFYSRAYFAEMLSDPICATFYLQGSQARPDYCFPSRLQEMQVLEAALRHNPEDARAHYYLGNLLYDKERRDEAIAHWEIASRLDPAFPTSDRNRGIAYYNVRRDPTRALDAYERAFRSDTSDARILYELDQLRKRIGVAPEERLSELESYRELVAQRDDLSVELVTLYNETGQSERALSILETRRFHPWEGGEGLVSGQYLNAHLLLGHKALDNGDAARALCHFDRARHYPQNLGEGKHLVFTQETNLDYLSGVAEEMLGRREHAINHWKTAASSNPDASMYAYFQALSFRKLGDEAGATVVLEALLEAVNRQLENVPKIDYFATSLPNFLLFEDDLKKRNEVESLFVRALAEIGLRDGTKASADLQRVLELDPNHILARVELERLKAKQGASIL